MNSQNVQLRRLGWSAAACALISALLLGAAIPLNERAVGLENGVTGDGASYAIGFALLLALIAGVLSLRFALNPDRGLLEAAIVVAVLAVLAGVGAGFLVVFGPVATHIQTCLAGHEAWLAVYTGPTPDACGNPAVPESEYSYFYPAMYLSWGAAALLLPSIVLLVRSGGRSMPASTQPFDPARARTLRLAGSACAAVEAVVLLAGILIGGFGLGSAFPEAVALVLAAIAAGTAFRSAARPEIRGVSAPITLASVSTAFALLGAFGASSEAAQYLTVLEAMAGAVGLACVVLMAAGRRA